jgi:hypothetical protein
MFWFIFHPELRHADCPFRAGFPLHRGRNRRRHRRRANAGRPDGASVKNGEITVQTRD